MTHPPHFIQQIQNYRNYCSAFVEFTTDGAHGISLLGKHPGFALTQVKINLLHTPLSLLLTNYYLCLVSPFYICMIGFCSASAATWWCQTPNLCLWEDVHSALCSLLSPHFQSAKHILLLPGGRVWLWWRETLESVWSSPRKKAFSTHVLANLENAANYQYKGQRRGTPGLCSSRPKHQLGPKLLVFEITGILTPSFLSFREKNFIN